MIRLWCIGYTFLIAHAKLYITNELMILLCNTSKWDIWLKNDKRRQSKATTEQIVTVVITSFNILPDK